MAGPFTYFSNIPVSTDQLSTSQPQILTNFNSIESLIDIDHIDFNSANAGQHNQISLPLNSNSPNPPTFSSGTIGLYNLVGATSVNELYLNKYTSSGQSQIPMTASILSTNSAPTAGQEWWTYLPSGLILKGGGNISQTSPYLFPVAATIPVFTQILTVVITATAPLGQTGYVTLAVANTTGFSFTLSPGFPSIGALEYVAIGY